MINTLQMINEEIKRNPQEFIEKCEKAYLDRISLVSQIIADDDNIKIVAIAGPSGSGKTTTAHILREKLEALGEKTAVVSLDDFYLPREQLPVLPDGSLDIESVNSLDIKLIKKCFNEIIDNGKALLPRYDFKTRSRIENDIKVDIGNRGIVIVEGLHALNPVIADVVARKNIYKIYISVTTPIETESGEQLLSSRQIRLIRRTLRDERSRGATPTDTLLLWNNVFEGERKYLYCFKNTADVKLATLHAYELCVYKERFCKMRQSVSPKTPCYDSFIAAANVLERFEGIDSSLVPANSLIREFIGDNL